MQAELVLQVAADERQRREVVERCVEEPLDLTAVQIDNPRGCSACPRARSRAACSAPGRACTAGRPPTRRVRPVRCDDAQAAISLRLDGELSGARSTSTTWTSTSAPAPSAPGSSATPSGSELRSGSRPSMPFPTWHPRCWRTWDRRGLPGAMRSGDAPGRRASPPRPRRPLVVAAALAAIAGMAAGAAFVGLGSEPRSPAAAELPDRVLAAQTGHRLARRQLPSRRARRPRGRWRAPVRRAAGLRGAGIARPQTLRQQGSRDADAGAGGRRRAMVAVDGAGRAPPPPTGALPARCPALGPLGQGP